MFCWNDAAEEAFRTPDFKKPFHLYTDACNDAVGAVLCQVVEGAMRSIEFMSRRFTSAEYNYGIYDKEVLVDYPLTIHTDNMVVKFITNNLTPSSRRMRWLVETTWWRTACPGSIPFI